MGFYADLRDASVPLQTKADVVAYFKATYPKVRYNKNGQEIAEWKSKLADALVPLTGEKRASIMRRFQGGRGAGEKVSKKTEQEYRDLGEMLPRQAPDGGYHIYGTVWVKYSDGECEEREIDEYITGVEADELAAMGSKNALQSVVNHYMEEDFDAEPTARIGECPEPDLHVEAME